MLKITQIKRHNKNLNNKRLKQRSDFSMKQNSSNMKYKFSISIIILSMFLFSCEGFLDKYPHSDVAFDQSLKTEDDMVVGINGIYSGFKSSAYYGRYFTVYPDIMTDEVASVNGFSNQLGILYKWIFTATDSDITAMWASMYSVIARANTIINTIDDVEGDKEFLDYLKGEALTARALAHFDLLRLFAKKYDPGTAGSDLGIPYMKEFIISEPPRDNIESVYNNIIDDLLSAYDLLIQSPYFSKADTHFSQTAVDAILARVYLYKQDWDNAIVHARKCIDSDNYSLTIGDEFANMWLNDEGAEIIWKVGLTVNDAAGKYPGYNYYNDSQGLPSPDYMPTDRFLSIYDQQNDIRFLTYFENVPTKYGKNLTLCSKYPTNPEFAATSNTNGANMPKVLRLAEQYLICAEAYAEKGESVLAWQYIQSIRASRIENYNPAEDAVPSNLKTEIFNERKRELAFEGHLWFDYKRKALGFERQGRAETGNNAMSNDIGPLKIEANNNRWVLPIPQDEINANSGMTEQQNPGY